MRATMFLVTGLLILISGVVLAAGPYRFEDIDGGEHDMAAWKGRPVLVVNTASQCSFTPQYEGLQSLYDRYRAAGLVVLAIPSDDFRQEFGTEAEVKEFCELTYGLDLPMTTITHVRGPEAHRFYADLKADAGWEPAWNFNKVLIGADGRVKGMWGSTTRPLSGVLTRAIEAELPGN